MTKDFITLFLAILSFSSLFAVYTNVPLAVALIIVSVASVSLELSPYYINAGYLGPFTGLGTILFLVLSLAFSSIPIAGFRWLRKKAEEKKNEHVISALYIMSALFAAHPVFRVVSAIASNWSL